MRNFHFETNWLFPAPINRVWQEIVAVPDWPDWWRGWRQATLAGSPTAVTPGVTIHHAVRGFLPYTLCFTTEIVEMQPPQRLTLQATGALVGQGCWQLHQNGQGTAVTFTWDVAAGNPWLDRLGALPFTRRLLEANHNTVMKRGYAGLRNRLASKSYEGVLI
jgi:hypothetical protein